MKLIQRGFAADTSLEHGRHMASPPKTARDLPLGQLIVEHDLLSETTVQRALAQAQASGRRLGEVLVDEGLLDDRTLAQLVAEQEELDFVDLGKYDLDPDAVRLLPARLARECQAVPFAFNETAVKVAVADPVDGWALDLVRTALARPVHFLVATRTEVESALSEAYDR
jgi:Type II secretion system (T2SS), protein E, N-terminal domain